MGKLEAGDSRPVGSEALTLSQGKEIAERSSDRGNKPTRT
jgi:hypothetical protein